MRLLSRWSRVTICILGLLLGSLSATLGRRTPAVAATPSGAAYAWGYNGAGELGNGTTTDSHTPAPITLAPEVTATTIAAGQGHSLALGSNGKVYAWGDNGKGELGNGTTSPSLTPLLVSLPPGVTATAIAAGQGYSLAIGSDATVYAWGDNSYGQLGNGTTTTSPNPTPVAITLANGVTAKAIATGNFHSLAIGSDGNMYAWGSNGNGQLGNGTTNGSSKPILVHLPAGMTPLTLGTGSTASHSLAILTSSGAPTAAVLSSFHVVHTGGAIRFHWRVASGAGLRGFFLTAGTHRLNRLLIRVNPQRQSYAYRSRWQGHGPYLLHGLLQGGAVVTLASTG